MRKKVKIAAGWVHATLVLALLLPLMCALGRNPGEMAERLFYIRCLLIAFPVAATWIAVEKCRGVFSYAAASAAVFAVTWLLGRWAAGTLEHGEEAFLYVPVLLGETVLVILLRFAGRVNQKKEQDRAEERDPNWKPYVDVLKTPSFMMFLYFFAVYFLGLNTYSPEVCNQALASVAVYGVAALLYRHVEETENYLSLNKRTCNLPSKRIYGIGNGMLACFLLLLAAAALPAFFSAGGRAYHDFRNGFKNWQVDYVEFGIGMDTMGGGDVLPDWVGQFGEPKPAPVWVTFLFYAAGAGIFLALAAAFGKWMFDMFRDFRVAVDENGDVVERLEDVEEEGMERVPEPAGSRRLTEREQVRRRYRRFIRKHRKDRPAMYESPAEIEGNAGVAQTAEGAEMHGRYEKARYGREQ